MGICNWIKAILGCKEQDKTIDAAKVDTFVKTWSLLDFAKKFGPKMEIGKFPEKSNRESFQKIRFTDSKGKWTYVSISDRIGEIIPEQLRNKKERLRVGQLANGGYMLYDSSSSNWEVIDLGLQ